MIELSDPTSSPAQPDESRRSPGVGGRLHSLHTEIAIATSLRDSAPDAETRAAREADLEKLTTEREELQKTPSAERPTPNP